MYAYSGRSHKILLLKYIESMKEILIGKNKVGDNNPCFLVAEIGNNHNWDIQIAKELISISAECGVNAVKFQTFRGSDIVNSAVSANEYPGWNVSAKYKSWSEYLDSFSLPFEWYPELIKFTHDKGLSFISTASSFENAVFLKELGAEAIKIASMDLNNVPMLKKISQLRLPIIISTGMATLGEISETVYAVGNTSFVLLHAISNYPTLSKELNLNNIKLLTNNFNVPVGFSDHSLEPISALSAVAVGAKIIEKHLTLDRKMEGPDHFFSTEPAEFKSMVEKIRLLEASLGSNSRRLGTREVEGRNNFRRSIQAKKIIEKGRVIKEEDIAILRPGDGIQPKFLSKVVGCVAKREIGPNTLLKWEDLEISSGEEVSSDNLSTVPFPKFLFNSQYLLDLESDKILKAWRNKNGDISKVDRGECTNLFYSLKKLSWDSRYFGVNCGILDEFQVNGETSNLNICDIFEDSKYGFILCRVNSADTNTNCVMINSGCIPVSVKYLFRFKNDSKHLRQDTVDEKYTLEDGDMVKDLDDLVLLTKKSIKHGRFFKDRHFNEKKSMGVYESWIRDFLKSENVHLKVIRSNMDKKITGFAAVTKHKVVINDKESFEYDFLELIAVDNKGIGMGSMLLESILTDMSKSKIHLLYANTPADNYSTVSFYYKKGFECIGALCEYHWWRKNS